MRISPFFPLEGGQRNGGIEHGGHHVHEGHFGHNDRVKVRPHIGDGAHQQTPGAAPHGDHPPTIAPAASQQRLGDINEVGKCVEFVVESARLVPASAFFLTAAHVGQRHHETAVYQGEEIGVEFRMIAETVGTVAHDVQRLAAVGHRTRGGQETHGNRGAVPGRRRHSQRAIVVSGKIGHGLPFQQRPLACGQIHVVDALRRGQ